MILLTLLLGCDDQTEAPQPEAVEAAAGEAAPETNTRTISLGHQRPAPEDIEYYICGPPMMLSAVLNMLDDLGVESDMIRFDDFGS